MSTETLHKRLSDSGAHIAQYVAQMSDSKIADKPNQDIWSVHEILEHLAVAESKVLRHFVQTIIPAGKTLDFEEKSNITSFLVNNLATDQRKIVAPESVVPKGRYRETAHAMEQIRSNTYAAQELLASYGEDLRNYTMHNAALGIISVYQWLEWIPSHRERHLLQMKGL
ncbi:MAG: DinB family protein [Saprospiraceae bacterium]